MLVFNGGSSSIPFAVPQVSPPLRRLLHGKVDRIGGSGTDVVITELGGPAHTCSLSTSGHRAAVTSLLNRLEDHPLFASVAAVGYRVVHGMAHTQPERLSPAHGLVMATRSGDLDPDLMAYLARDRHMTPTQFRRMVNEDSGLLGISEASADMRDLLAAEPSDVRAAEAVALFYYEARKWVGAYAAALGGLDTRVFSGGIGENVAIVRSRICEGLGFLGIALDGKRNAAHAPLISTDAGRVQVRVIPTDEELMVATDVVRTLHLDGAAGRPRATVRGTTRRGGT